MIKFAPLPKVMTSEDMNAFIYIQNADGINLMAGNKNSGRRLMVDGNKVVSESIVKLLYLGSAFNTGTDIQPAEASILVECN